MSAELTATSAKGASAELVRVAYFGLSAGAALAGAGIRVRCGVPVIRKLDSRLKLRRYRRSWSSSG